VYKELDYQKLGQRSILVCYCGIKVFYLYIIGIYFLKYFSLNAYQFNSSIMDEFILK